MNRALLLNASREPLAIIRDRDAVELYLEELADPIEYSGEVFRSPSTQVMVPSVLVLRKYVVMPEKHRSIMLITSNVCARDGYRCGYCQKDVRQDGTIDHIVPRALGGKHTWENVTACCRRCNQKKGHQTLDSLGWELHNTPFRPKGVAAHLLKIRPDPAWEPYLAIGRPTLVASMSTAE
jgi:5-methylcytosine-specific restriction endonuclease McrA